MSKIIFYRKVFSFLFLTMILFFQNCSKSFQTKSVKLESLESASLDANYNIGFDPISYQFGQIQDVSVDSDHDQVYFIDSNSSLYKYDIKTKLAYILKRPQVGLDEQQLFSYSNIEIDPSTGDVYTIEYEHLGEFNSVKKLNSRGQWIEVLNKNSFNKEGYVRHLQDNTTTTFLIHEWASMALERYQNTVMLRIVTLDNSYVRINLQSLEPLDTWAYYCLRRNECGGSADIMYLWMIVQGEYPNNTDSKRNWYVPGDNCQLTIMGTALDTGSGFEYLGVPCKK